MPWDPSVLCKDRPEDLPGCSWEEFCEVVGIERPDWAQELLRRIAGRYRNSGTEALPAAIVEQAARISKDPYVLWMRATHIDFRGEPEGMPMQDNPMEADSYYLLHVMTRQCKGQVKDWASLADECMNDKELYRQVKLQVLHRLGFAGALDIPQYPD